jgi:hypothetical protein
MSKNSDYALFPEIQALKDELGPMSIEDLSYIRMSEEFVDFFGRLEGKLHCVEKGGTDEYTKTVEAFRPEWERLSKKRRLLHLYEIEGQKWGDLILAFWQNFKIKRHQEYEINWTSLEPMIKAKGHAIPANSQHFFEWFFGVKHRNSDPLELDKLVKV